MGSPLEVFGLPSSQLGVLCAEGTKNKIRGNVLSAKNQADIGRTKCQQLNKDQAHALSAIMEAVNDDTYVNRLFFLNAPRGYGKPS